MPTVGICCDRRVRKDHVWHAVAEEYIEAMRGVAGLTPLLIPSLPAPLDPAEILPRVDALLFTGSVSNVAPARYRGEAPRKPELLDEARDAVTLPLIRAAIDRGMPLFCICRGFQELNVALGGTLHQHIQEVPGFGDHREKESDPYAPAHEVQVASGGVLERILLGRFAAGQDIKFQVNSLHEQGVKDLSPLLRVEARASDGVIEAVSLKNPKGFCLGVQWHPEWNARENPISVGIFTAFAAAAASAQ